MRKAAYTLLIYILVLSACGNKVYDRYEHTPIGGWEKNDTLTFHVPKMAKAGVYQEELGLRIDNSFPFMRLALIVETTVIPDFQVLRDTVTPELVDAHGRYTGSGISHFQYTVPVREIHLKEGDSLRICIRHDMKREIMPGISDVGIILSGK
ncbi:gliding motility lipoprotein GldH [Prevotella sp. oral taxon 376]|uniref:gliding motility lipoprotein GldH n=1 Tax=Prevotella sp. oral taxon 376 TaxID=712466 RepID=UPI000D1E5D1D|nr:gliding motility lipoprotein GldH [Prevotella sp. oral taxon 376]PTL34184.1 gliding motility lipoprotein GldH [Prevotella sp. oral taxon 376]